jgi:hypothetical protein
MFDNTERRFPKCYTTVNRTKLQEIFTKPEATTDLSNGLVQLHYVMN